jgi:3D (Asp-Asp-Asp) domain-containing protein
MTRHTLSLLLLALVIVVPARASHHHAASHSKTLAKVAAKPAAAAPQPAGAPISSTKGTRLVADSLLPGARAAAPKKIAAKAAVKSTPLVAAKTPAPAPALPAPAVTVSAAPLRLARLTAYWTQEDPWTAKHESSTGVRLQEGYCAVDPKLIPYGSTIQIPGLRPYVAVDTGSAVISREAAVGSGHTQAERNALVVDLFFENRKDAENFAAHGPAYVAVSWTKPLASADSPLNPLALPAVSTVPKMPAGIIYVLAQAPSIADMRMPLAFRSPQM